VEEAALGETILYVLHLRSMDSTNTQQTRIIIPIKKPSSNTSSGIPVFSHTTSGLSSRTLQ